MSPLSLIPALSRNLYLCAGENKDYEDKAAIKNRDIASGSSFDYSEKKFIKNEWLRFFTFL